MRADMIKFFAVQRQIFGVCTCCGELFRLSDANMYMKKKPMPDWMVSLISFLLAMMLYCY